MRRDTPFNHDAWLTEDLGDADARRDAVEKENTSRPSELLTLDLCDLVRLYVAA